MKCVFCCREDAELYVINYRNETVHACEGCESRLNAADICECQECFNHRIKAEKENMKEQEVKSTIDTTTQKMLTVTMDQRAELQKILKDFISDRESEFNKQIDIARARYIIGWIDSAKAIIEKL